MASLKVNDLVGIGFFRNFCGGCEYCLEGSEQYCETAPHLDFLTAYPKFGTLSSVVQVSAKACLLLPKNSMPVAYLPFLSSGLSIYSALRPHLNSEEREVSEIRMAVIGLGGLGQIALQLAKALDIDVTGFTRSSRKKAIIKSMGFRVGEKMAECNGQYNLVMICSRKLDHELLELCLGMVEPEGHMVVASSYAGKLPISYELLIDRRITISCPRSGSRKHLQELLDLVDRRQIGIETEEFPAQRLKAAVDRMKDNPFERLFVKFEEDGLGAPVPDLDVPEEKQEAHRDIVEIIQALKER